MLFALTFVLPILTAVGSSFTRVTRAGLFGEEGVTSGFAGFANYAQALGDGNFIASIGRMLLFGVVQVPVMIVLATILRSHRIRLVSSSKVSPARRGATMGPPDGIPMIYEGAREA